MASAADPTYANITQSSTWCAEGGDEKPLLEGKLKLSGMLSWTKYEHQLFTDRLVQLHPSKNHVEIPIRTITVSSKGVSDFEVHFQATTWLLRADSQVERDSWLAQLNKLISQCFSTTLLSGLIWSDPERMQLRSQIRDFLQRQPNEFGLIQCYTILRRLVHQFSIMCPCQAMQPLLPPLTQWLASCRDALALDVQEWRGDQGRALVVEADHGVSESLSNGCAVPVIPLQDVCYSQEIFLWALAVLTAIRESLPSQLRGALHRTTPAVQGAEGYVSNAVFGLPLLQATAGLWSSLDLTHVPPEMRPSAWLLLEQVLLWCLLRHQAAALRFLQQDMGGAGRLLQGELEKYEMVLENALDGFLKGSAEQQQRGNEGLKSRIRSVATQSGLDSLWEPLGAERGSQFQLALMHAFFVRKIIVYAGENRPRVSKDGGALIAALEDIAKRAGQREASRTQSPFAPMFFVTHAGAPATAPP
mmetsp:Transcript_13547/g.31189  ORF Transcript_13547/g.31189 Transcript_13547/m.31189 type:complete len:474 (+) Transcript_13547:50-1471(+)